MPQAGRPLHVDAVREGVLVFAQRRPRLRQARLRSVRLGMRRGSGASMKTGAVFRANTRVVGRRFVFIYPPSAHTHRHVARRLCSFRSQLCPRVAMLCRRERYPLSLGSRAPHALYLSRPLHSSPQSRNQSARERSAGQLHINPATVKRILTLTPAPPLFTSGVSERNLRRLRRIR